MAQARERIVAAWHDTRPGARRDPAPTQGVPQEDAGEGRPVLVGSGSRRS